MGRGKNVAIGIAVAVPVLCGVGGVLWFNKNFGQMAGSLDSEISYAKAHGFKTEPEELARHVPPSQNAAGLMHQLTNMALADPQVKADEEDISRVHWIRPTAADRKAAEEAFGRLGAVYAKLEAMADKPHLEMTRDWRHFYSGPLPMDYTGIRCWNYLLIYKAQHLERAGKQEEALQTIERDFKLGRLCEEDPTLVSFALGVMVQDSALSELQTWLRRNSRDDRSMSMAIAWVKSLGALPNLRTMVNSELIEGRAIVWELRSHSYSSMAGPPGSSDPLMDMMSSSPTVRRAFEADLMRRYNKLLTEMPEDPNDVDGMSRAMDAYANDVIADLSRAASISRVTCPNFVSMAKSIENQLVRRRLIACGARLAMMRNANHRLPTTLPDFGTDSIDPYGKAPFRYRVEGDGFVLYSVGVDGIDNRGDCSNPIDTKDIVLDMR